MEAHVHRKVQWMFMCKCLEKQYKYLTRSPLKVGSRMGYSITYDPYSYNLRTVQGWQMISFERVVSYAAFLCEDCAYINLTYVQFPFPMQNLTWLYIRTITVEVLPTLPDIAYLIAQSEGNMTFT